MVFEAFYPLHHHFRERAHSSNLLLDEIGAPAFASSISLSLKVCLWRLLVETLSLLSLKLSYFSRCVGLTSPEAMADKSCSLLSLRARRISGTLCSTIWRRSGAISTKAVSSGSSNHDFIEIPFSGCNRKFSVILSTMIVLLSSRPRQLKSLMNTSMHWIV